MSRYARNCYEEVAEYAENRGHRKGKSKSKKRAAAKRRATTEYVPRRATKKAKKSRSTWTRSAKTATASKRSRKAAKGKSRSTVPVSALLKQLQTANRVLTMALGQLMKRI